MAMFGDAEDKADTVEAFVTEVKNVLSQIAEPARTRIRESIAEVEEIIEELREEEEDE